MNKKKDIDLKQVRSINKNVRSSVRKLKPILKSIVGKKVEIAIRDLSFSEKRISKDVKKTISSAVANAEHNLGMDPSTLVISSAWANNGPVMKRYRPRAQGRAFSIKKQTCHISISVESVPTQINAEVQK